MRIKLVALIVLASAGQCVIAATPAADGRNLRKLLRELHKGAPPVVQQLSRRAVKVRSKNIVSDMKYLLRATGVRVETPFGSYRTHRKPLEEYEDDLRALVNEAISLDAADAVKLGFGVEEKWLYMRHSVAKKMPPQRAETFR